MPGFSMLAVALCLEQHTSAWCIVSIAAWPHTASPHGLKDPPGQTVELQTLLLLLLSGLSGPWEYQCHKPHVSYTYFSFQTMRIHFCLFVCLYICMYVCFAQISLHRVVPKPQQPENTSLAVTSSSCFCLIVSG